MINAQPKPVRHIEKKYREWIKTMPCIFAPGSLCCAGPIDPHHAIPKGEGRTGSKVSDRRCVPVCRYHHEVVEAHPDEWRVFLEGLIPILNARYNREHPQRPSKVREKRHATLKIEGTCPKRHRVNVALGKLWCDRCSEYMEVA